MEFSCSVSTVKCPRRRAINYNKKNGFCTICHPAERLIYCKNYTKTLHIYFPQAWPRQQWLIVEKIFHMTNCFSCKHLDRSSGWPVDSTAAYLLYCTFQAPTLILVIQLAQPQTTLINSFLHVVNSKKLYWWFFKNLFTAGEVTVTTE